MVQKCKQYYRIPGARICMDNNQIISQSRLLVYNNIIGVHFELTIWQIQNMNRSEMRLKREINLKKYSFHMCVEY
jgi:hypothetical protein